MVILLESILLPIHLFFCNILPQGTCAFSFLYELMQLLFIVQMTEIMFAKHLQYILDNYYINFIVFAIPLFAIPLQFILDYKI